MGVHQPCIPPSPLAKPTLLQYYCTTIVQFTPPPPTPLLYAVNNTILVMAISCRRQLLSGVWRARMRSGVTTRLIWATRATTPSIRPATASSAALNNGTALTSSLLASARVMMIVAVCARARWRCVANAAKQLVLMVLLQVAVCTAGNTASASTASG